jgi:hypothetical protein
VSAEPDGYNEAAQAITGMNTTRVTDTPRGILDAEEDYRLPRLLSPYGYSSVFGGL